MTSTNDTHGLRAFPSQCHRPRFGDAERSATQIYALQKENGACVDYSGLAIQTMIGLKASSLVKTLPPW